MRAPPIPPPPQGTPPPPRITPPPVAIPQKVAAPPIPMSTPPIPMYTPPFPMSTPPPVPRPPPVQAPTSLVLPLPVPTPLPSPVVATAPLDSPATSVEPANHGSAVSSNPKMEPHEPAGGLSTAEKTENETRRTPIGKQKQPKKPLKQQTIPIGCIQVYLLLEMIVLIGCCGYAVSVWLQWWNYISLLGWPMFVVQLSALMYLTANLCCQLLENFSLTAIRQMRFSSLHATNIRAALVSKTVFLVCTITLGSLYFTQLRDISSLLRTPLGHVVDYSFHNNTEHHTDIHVLQQELKCCGVRGVHEPNVTKGLALYDGHPWTSWFRSHVLDETYTSPVRSLLSLPYSCCNQSASVCHHIGISRYLHKFSSASQFETFEASLNADSWMPYEWEDRHNRSKTAFDSLYQTDCAVAVAKVWRTSSVQMSIIFLIAGVLNVVSIALLVLLYVLLLMKQRKDKTEKSKAPVDLVSESSDVVLRSSQETSPKKK